MNLAAYGHKFFVFCGVILLAVAVLQWWNRPGAEGGKRPKASFDAATVQALFFVAAGILTILVGVGVIPIPGRH